MLGKLLDGRYRIIKELAEGGFSQTYLAEDTRLPKNPQCVVKHLNPTIDDPIFTQKALELFKAEAETLQELGKHDLIPQLYAYFEENVHLDLYLPSLILSLQERSDRDDLK